MTFLLGGDILRSYSEVMRADGARRRYHPVNERKISVSSTVSVRLTRLRNMICLMSAMLSGLSGASTVRDCLVHKQQRQP